MLPKPYEPGTPRWVLIGTGFLGLVAALLVVVARYYEARRARADAERAEAARHRAPNVPAHPPQPPARDTRPTAPVAEPPARDARAGEPIAGRQPSPRTVSPAPPDPAPPPPATPPAARPGRKLVPVYKVVLPGDVVLTTDADEARDLGRKYPGQFAGKTGHHQGILGFGYDRPQPGAVRLRRYLVPGTGRRAYWKEASPNPGHMEEPMGLWVPAGPTPGASPRLVMFRKDRDGKTEYEYADEATARRLERSGYREGKDRSFYLFDSPPPP